MSKKQKPKHCQEPLFEELKKDWCYICYGWIKGDGVYVGGGIYRHKKCKPIIISPDKNLQSPEAVQET